MPCQSSEAGTPFSLLSLTLPVAMGYVPLGAVFGFLFVQAGGTGWLAVLSSLIVYSGAAQFMMIPMFAAGLPISTIVLATFVLNSRHAFYGLSLLDYQPKSRWKRWYSIYALTDETYSVLTALPPDVRQQKGALLTVLNQGWWVSGTAFGVLLSTQIKLNLAGLDFVLAALFAVLTVEQWRVRRDVVPVVIGVVSYGLALWWVPSQALLVAMIISFLVVMIRISFKSRRKVQHG